ncbi:Quinate dehydrogenase [Lachnellula cervina]|uniref:Quinate dehydrogenase n=1 Tax=Lachnellula cervina TaxID=1316786 RepID=A0A7D8UMX6_9HELO|nr:Quinate dehydrogenase [Lachnellula cervina]
MDTLKQSYNYGTSPLTSDSVKTPLRMYLFGKPVAHSLSPLLHSILFKSVSVPWTFHLVETTSAIDFTETLKRPDFIGGSVTMPNKITFMPLLDDLTEEARVIGAVNTSFIRLDSQGNRRHIGTNTDCIGIRETLLQNVPGIAKSSTKQPALVIGGGGAARSAIFALWKWLGPSEIYLVNRLKSEVDTIIASFETTMPGIKLRHVNTIESARSLPTPSVVVGTVPDFPPTRPDEILSWQICEAFMKKDGRKGVLLDMCYYPSPVTRLVVMAERNGWSTIRGTEVLVRVCAAQRILWLEREQNDVGVNQALSAIREKFTHKL